MNNSEKIEKIEEYRKELAEELKTKCNQISDTSGLYKVGPAPHKAWGWKDTDGETLDVTFNGLEYDYPEAIHKEFSIDAINEMIGIANKLLVCIDTNINTEYLKIK